MMSFLLESCGFSPPPPPPCAARRRRHSGALSSPVPHADASLRRTSVPLPTPTRHSGVLSVPAHADASSPRTSVPLPTPTRHPAHAVPAHADARPALSLLAHADAHPAHPALHHALIPTPARAATTPQPPLITHHIFFIFLLSKTHTTTPQLAESNIHKLPQLAESKFTNAPN
ncbi:hypothetical protein Zmor_005525 [Zophobas morio]|uniref:Uncharacterized protein n=1 Tax=Zophobas morio TaxID=2755281 RepID=A0AA38IXW4_9CUCU|nr:hypothetical protein Zmor_005525 [Zophobas morio]